MILFKSLGVSKTVYKEILKDLLTVVFARYNDKVGMNLMLKIVTKRHSSNKKIWRISYKLNVCGLFVSLPFKIF